MRPISKRNILTASFLFMPQVQTPIAALAFLTFAFCSVSLAQDAKTADLGMDAPELSIAEWIKGGPVKLSEGKGKTIYVVEFWATWCMPCRTSIPHLTELQKKFKDKNVVIIGVSNEKPDTVKPFVEKMAEKMDYAVAVDKDGDTNKSYMKAFDQNGIPHAFLINKEGKIVWQGHPMAGLDDTLEQVIAGTYDIEAAKKKNREDEARSKAFMSVMKNVQQYFEIVTDAKGDKAEAKKIGQQILSNASKIPEELLNRIAWDILVSKRVVERDKDLAMRLAKAAVEASKGALPHIRDTYARALWAIGKKAEAIKEQAEALAQAKTEAAREELRKALELMKEGKDPLADIKATPEEQRAEQMDKIQALADSYFALVKNKNADAAKVKQLGEQILKASAGAPLLQNEIAWKIMTDDDVARRDTDLALSLAQAAAEATRRSAPEILDTYARARFMTGKIDEAIKAQKEAIKLCKDEAMRDELKKSLDEYQAKAEQKK
ncbi:MAG: redoxin domain-containing protein [Candidatus Sumerlaeota bacterium]|nr:redoxin domain-containing protein [Candidatus Sumerlaeota bacterium]